MVSLSQLRRGPTQSGQGPQDSSQNAAGMVGGCPGVPKYMPGCKLSQKALCGFPSCTHGGGGAGILRADFDHPVDYNALGQGPSPQRGLLRALTKQTCLQMLSLSKIQGIPPPTLHSPPSTPHPPVIRHSHVTAGICPFATLDTWDIVSLFFFTLKQIRFYTLLG